ncbi:exonuclease, partial [Leptospira ellisii]
HVTHDFAGKAFDVLKSFYLNQFSKKLREEYPDAWESVLNHRKEFRIDDNFPLVGIEERFVSEELRIIGENLTGMIPDSYNDFLILANYISEKNDQERILRSTNEELKSIKMLKTMMSMKSDTLSQFVTINLEEDKEFTHSVVDNLRRDPDCIVCDWYEKGKKITCLCYKKEETLFSLIQIMTEKYPFKTDLIKNFLFLVKKEKNEIGLLYQRPEFKNTILKLKYVCYKNNLSWFSKVLAILGAYGMLETSLDHEESVTQFEQLTREIEYKENRKKQLEKIRSVWLGEIQSN